MTDSLRDKAIEIWQAGVDAVASDQLVRNAVSYEGGVLHVAGHVFPLSEVSRIVIVGAGKAGAGMAAAIEELLPDNVLKDADSRCELTGWVNVPADCVKALPRIHLHAARPAGVNEPTEAGVAGSNRILEMVSGLTDSDLCLVLLSGGGSALLPAPVDGVSLQDKQTVTRLLMHGGATINELNCVRKQLSLVKGGRLASASPAGKMISLIISDVIGDPLDVIASGPTVEDKSTPAEAIDVLKRRVDDQARIPHSVRESLERSVLASKQSLSIDHFRVFNYVIGNNSAAVNAAAARANALGYQVINRGSGQSGVASEIGYELARQSLAILNDSDPCTPPACIISGGEPVVHLAETDQPRKGGRNQELVLAAVEALWNEDCGRLAILSGGTDGEDGPTDAAGAILDAEVLSEAQRQGLNPSEFLAINNSYEFFDRARGLLKTGPTHTNVMDLRVALISE